MQFDLKTALFLRPFKEESFEDSGLPPIASNPRLVVGKLFAGAISIACLPVVAFAPNYFVALLGTFAGLQFLLAIDYFRMGYKARAANDLVQGGFVAIMVALILFSGRT